MEDRNPFWAALAMVARFDPEVMGIVSLSLQVTFTALFVAVLIGLPIGGLLGISRFPGRSVLTVVFNALMGLPPVVAGLAVYLLLSRAGPLGGLDLLFTPGAMVIAQVTLIAPIVISLTRQSVEDLWREYGAYLRSLGLGPFRAVPTLLWDGRYSLVTGILAGFGRAAAEVGAVMIVGGNIAGHTRMMTTAITLETSRGRLGVAMALGLILLTLVLAVNAAAYLLTRYGERRGQ